MEDEHRCRYCGGLLEQVSPGFWQCEDCGRGVAGRHIRD